MAQEYRFSHTNSRVTFHERTCTMTKASDAAEIIRRLKECEGEKVSHKIEELNATFFIFSENRKQLLTAISAFEHPPNMTAIWRVENRPTLRSFHEEIARLLHNYLASAATLIDHTRIFARDLYQGKPFYEEYKKKRDDTFKPSELAGFIKGLRNWMLHKGLAPTVAKLSGEGTTTSPLSAIVLNYEKLKTWDRWDTRAKAYIANLSSDPKLHTIVSSYGSLVESFYEWLENRIQEIHAAAFQELDELQDQLRTIQDQEF
jgi:hypothetical protein